MRLTYYQAILIVYIWRKRRVFETAWQRFRKGLNSAGSGRPLILLITICIVLGLSGSAACANGGTNQQQGNTGGIAGATVSPPVVTPPVSPAPPIAPLPPPAVPQTTGQPDQAASTPPDSNPPAAATLDTTSVITRPASQMTLTLDDMGAGWAQGNAIAPALQQVTSSSHVSYSQGSSYAPGVQNTVAVYRSIDMANRAYAKEKEANLSTSNPNIGDECLLNDSVPINKLLVFRKNNVVVWLWLKQYKDGNIEGYARTVEQKITASAPPPVAPGPSSQTATTPSQQTPVEPSAGLQPAVAKPTEGLTAKQAYQMILTGEDMGTGWVKGNVSPPANTNSLSSSYASYSQGSNFAPTVQNTVIVYRGIEAAISAYDGAKPSGGSLSNPAIGDECFLNDSVPIDRLLVFRKANVVVWIWLKQYKSGDIEGYAGTVEKKITF